MWHARSSWRTREGAEELHRAYLARGAQTVEQIAAQFGISSAYMYRLFAEFDLPRQQGSSRVWEVEMVAAMHEDYLSSPDHPPQVAKRYGVRANTMYKLFRRFGLDERRNTRAGRSTRLEKAGQCNPGYDHTFCLWCPCPIPPCAEGHGGKRGKEWACDDCTLRKACSCWDPKIRTEYGLAEVVATWRRRLRSK